MATAPHVMVGPGSQLITTVIAVLPESEYLMEQDANCVHALVNGFNLAYEYGQKGMFVFMSAILIILAPFIGIAAAMYSYISAVFRAGAVPVGRWFADMSGYGPLVRTRAAYVLWQRKKAHQAGTVALRLPTTGSRPNSRFPALPEDELLGPHPGIGIKPLLRAFNIAFSWGFVVGTVICTSLTFVLAPFIGMFVGAGTFLIALLRTFSRNDGRFLTTLFGVADLVDQEVARMQEEMGIEHLQAQDTTPLTAGQAVRPGPGGGGAAAQSPAAQPLIGANFLPVITQPMPASQAAFPQYALQVTAGGQYQTAAVSGYQASYGSQAPPAYPGYQHVAVPGAVYQAPQATAVATAAPVHAGSMIQSQEDPGPAIVVKSSQ